MTKETILRLKAHFEKLSQEGIESDNPIRVSLVKADAKRHLEEIEAKLKVIEEKEKVSKPNVLQKIAEQKAIKKNKEDKE